jgi:hypothetical protein
MILFHVQTVLSFDTFSSYVKTKPILKLHCVRQTSIINPLLNYSGIIPYQFPITWLILKLSLIVNSTNSVNFVIYVLSSFFTSAKHKTMNQVMFNCILLCMAIDILCYQGKVHQRIQGVWSKHAGRFPRGFSSLTEWKTFTRRWEWELEYEDQYNTQFIQGIHWRNPWGS